jgi:hypothetical protein
VATKCVLKCGTTWMNTELSHGMQVMQASHKTMQNNKNVHVGRTSRLANNTRHLETCIVLSKSVKHTNMVCLVNHKISDTNQTHLLAPSAVQSSRFMSHVFQSGDHAVIRISFRKDGLKFIEKVAVSWSHEFKSRRLITNSMEQKPS